MDKKSLDKYRQLLLALKSQILNGPLFNSTEDLAVQPEDLSEEGDLAASVINQQITFSMRNRELAKLRRIEGALERIENDSFGCCEECDEVIGQKRLTNQPWATLCITHAEEVERESAQRARTTAY